VVESKWWSQKLFWKLIVSTFVISILLVAILNVVADPFGIYGTGLYPPVASNRYFELRVSLENCEPPPGALIIGSSRVDCLDEGLVTELTGYKCVNCWGPGATPEIYLAILKMALDEFHHPIKLVIVGVEPGILLNEQNEVHPQAKILLSYQRYLSKTPELSVFCEKSKRLISREQTIASLFVLTGRAENLSTNDLMDWIPTQDLDFGIRRVGGNPEDRLQAEIRYRVDRLKNFGNRGLSESRTRCWDEFLEMCCDNKIEVYAFTQPAHPDLTKILYENNAGEIYRPSVDHLEKSVLEVGGEFRGYIYPDEFGADSENFRDAVHMDKEGGDKLLEDLLAGFGK